MGGRCCESAARHVTRLDWAGMAVWLDGWRGGGGLSRGQEEVTMRLELSRRLALSLSLGIVLSLGAVLPAAAAPRAPVDIDRRDPDGGRR